MIGNVCLNMAKHKTDCLVGLVVKTPASRAADRGFDSRLRRGDFSGTSTTSNSKLSTPVVTLPGPPGVMGSALVGPVWLDEIGLRSQPCQTEPYQ